MYLRYFPEEPLAERSAVLHRRVSLRGRQVAGRGAAYNQVIASYPRGTSVADAYYKRGLAFERLGQVDRARESYDVRQNFSRELSRAARQAERSIG